MSQEKNSSEEPFIVEMKVPFQWTTSTLSEICEVITDGDHQAPPKTEEGIPFLVISDVKDGEIGFEKCRFVPEQYYNELKDYRKPKVGDVLYTVVGSFGIPALVTHNRPFCFQRHIALLRPCPGIHSRFLYYFLRTDFAFQQARKAATGTAQLTVPLTGLRNINILIPSLAEQQRIVAKLDALMEKVESARERLEKIPAILKRFRQAVLAAAVSGRLTADWREQNPEVSLKTVYSIKPKKYSRDGWVIWDDPRIKSINIPTTWKWTYFDDLLEKIRSGTTEVPCDVETNHKILRSSSVRPGEIDYTDYRFLREDQVTNANLLQKGDLLFTRLNGSIEYVGNCAIVDNLPDESISYPDRLFCAKLLEKRFGPFCQMSFSASTLRGFLVENVKSTAGHQRISIDAILKQPIPLPPFEEQQEITTRAAALFRLADNIEARYKASKSYLDRLPQSILAKAFRGELVLQDPSDEPASVLLEHIKSLKTGTSKKREKHAAQLLLDITN